MMSDDAVMEVPLPQRLHNARTNNNNQSSPRDGAPSSNDRDDDADMREAPEDAVNPRPWYMPWSTPVPPGSGFMGTLTRVVSQDRDKNSRGGGGEDSREQDDDMFMEREGAEDAQSRIHEPLKRYQQERHYHDDYGQEEQSNKRRRVVSPTESISMSFYDMVPALTERQQAVVEYTAPSTFTPLFKYLGYTPFAVQWVVVMYLGHFVQTALSTFGEESKSLRFKAWIPPLVHHLIDTYVWNHSMITYMLLDPAKFGNSAYCPPYWLAVFFTMAQQQLYLVVSLKTHYIKNQDKLVEDKTIRFEIEKRFVDCFCLYGIAAILFTLAKILDMRSLLWIGLVEFNLMPLYLVWAHKKRMDAATISGSKVTKKQQ